MIIKKTLMAFAAIAAASISTTAHAVTLDVDHTGFSDGVIGVGQRSINLFAPQLSQSFEVGLGGILHSISFQARESETSSLGLFFEIRTLVGTDLPSPTDILYSTSLSASAFSSAYQTYEIDVSSAAITVAPGDRLAFVIGQNAPPPVNNGSYGVFTNFRNTYSDGVNLCGSLGNPNAFSGPCGGNDGDFWFQTTVNTMPPVPLPASLPLLLSGLLGFGLLARRRKAA